MTEERARLIGQRSALLAKMRAIAKDVRGDDPTRRGSHAAMEPEDAHLVEGGGARPAISHTRGHLSR